MKKQDKTRRFDSVTLGMPPLKMVLVNTDEIRSEGQKKARVLRRLAKDAKYRTAVEKLIAHLTKMQA